MSKYYWCRKCNSLKINKNENSLSFFIVLSWNLPVKNLAEVLDTTVGFLLGETTQINILKDPTMLRRLNDLINLPEKDRECILYTLDSLLQNVKTRQAFV